MTTKNIKMHKQKPLEKPTMTIQDIIDNNKIDIKSANRRSYTWYMNKVVTISSNGNVANNAEQLITKGLKGRRSKTEQGFMYLFGYQAKHADTLEYWDKYPLVLPFNTDSKGFTAFNIHYLPYRTRSIMLQRCLEFASNDKMDYSTRIKITWKLVSSFSKMEALSYCVKRYLWSHVKTPFKQIPVEDWGIVALLPIQKFVGLNASNKVWQDTINKVGKRK